MCKLATKGMILILNRYFMPYRQRKTIYPSSCVQSRSVLFLGVARENYIFDIYAKE